MRTIACLIALAAATGAATTIASAKERTKTPTTTAPTSKRSLTDFLPTALGDAKRQKDPPPSPSAPKPPEPRDAHAAYLLPDPRFVNVNLMWVRDLTFEQAQYRVHVPGERDENTAARLSHEGIDVDGLFVQRTQYLPAPGGKSGAGKSEARALLADKIVVLVSVEKATTPNEPIEWLRKLDLAGLTAFAAGAAAPAPATTTADPAPLPALDDGLPRVVDEPLGKGDGDSVLPAGPEGPPPPLTLFVVHADPKPLKKGEPKQVKMRIVNASKKPVTLFLNSGDPSGPGAFSFSVDDADWLPVEVEHRHDGKLITHKLAPGKDYLLSIGPDLQFRGHLVKVRYQTGDQHHALCKDCWVGTVTSSALAVPGDRL